MRHQIFAEMNIPAPGADTDLLDENFGLGENERGSAKVEIVAQLVTESKLHLIARRKTGPTKATGKLTCVAGASLADGDDFTLDDGINPAVNFEFDSSGAIAGDYPITFDTHMTLEQIVHQVVDAINEAHAAEDLEIEAEVGTVAGEVLLTHTVGGTDGNQTISEAVTNAGFTVVSMAGGLDDDEVILPLNLDVELAEGTPYTLEIPITADHEYNLQLDEDGDIELLQVSVVKGE